MKLINYLVPRVFYSSSSKVSSNSDAFFKSPWKQLIDISTALFFAYILLATVKYILPLLFFFYLSQLVVPGGNVGITVFDIFRLGVIAFLSFIFSIANIYLDRYVSLRLCNKFELLLNRSISGNLSKIERLASRDIGVVIDGIGDTINLLAVPIFLIGATIFLLVEFGVGGLYCIAMCLLFIPFTYWLSRAADANYNSVIDLVSARIEWCSGWIRKGPFLKKFNKNSSFSVIVESTEEELVKRNIDTVLRGADSYLVGFGRLVPFVLMSVAGGAAYGLDWEGAIFWLAIPLLSAVLTMPKTIVSYKQVRRSLAELVKFHAGFQLESNQTNSDTSSDLRCFNFNSDWPIWSSELSGLLADLDSVGENEVSTLLVELRLIPEFGSTPELVLGKIIEINGGNVSDGQKTRIQLLRGFCAAKATGCKMVVNNDLSSLDASVAKSALLALTFTGVVEFTIAAEASISARKVSFDANADDFNPASDESAGLANNRSLFIERPFLVGVALLFVPAIMMGYSANLTLNDYSPFQLMFYIVAGVVTGILAGLYVEANTRKGFSLLLINGLKNIQEGETSNTLQIVTRDIDIAYERLSWYSHDIAWVSALLVFSIFALGIGVGGFGILLALFFSGLIYALYYISIEELYSTRVASIGGFNSLLKAVQNVHVLSMAYSSPVGTTESHLKRVHMQQVLSGITNFYVSRTKASIVRSTTAVLCRAISDFSVVSIAAICLLLDVASVGFVFAVTSLLLIRGDVANVFLAMTGYKSQSISRDRLLEFSKVSQPVCVSTDGFLVQIPAFKGISCYRSLKIKAGSISTLVGVSGSGKSQYMKGVAGVTRTELQAGENSLERVVECYYLNSSVLEYLGFCVEGTVSVESLIDYLRGLFFHQQSLLLLDEITSGLSIEQAYKFVECLHGVALRNSLTVMIVDHRLTLENSVPLSTIVTRRVAEPLL